MRVSISLLVILVLTSIVRADAPRKVDVAHDIIPLLNARSEDNFSVSGQPVIGLSLERS